MVDPTPRAVAHFEDLEARIGEPSREPYSTTGRQSVRAYDLTSIALGQLQLDGRALTGSSGTVRFYAPRNPCDVSYSIVNFQNDYATDTKWIGVPAVSVADLLEEAGIPDLELLKLDIEGAEIEVLPAMLSVGIRPRQILVEYDELNWPSGRSRRNFDRVHGALISGGYVVTAFDRRSCVSYLYATQTRTDASTLGPEWIR
jgi:FkbM family methyltransferase